MNSDSAMAGRQTAADDRGGEPVSAENPPVIIVFTNEQKEALRGTILNGSRGIRILQGTGHLIAEQLA
jgi:hypothetical protein